MKHVPKQGFTLIELIVVIVILGVIAVVAVPRFLNYSQEAETAKVATLFENFATSVNIYQATCYARGGDAESGKHDNSNPFDIEGIKSNFSGTCYPARKNSRNINNPNNCFATFATMVNSSHYDDHPRFSSTNPQQGGENANRVSYDDLLIAKQNGFKVFIHQRFRYHSYCHFYSLEGDLSQAPFILYNAVDGEMVSGITDLSQDLNWSDEITKYSQATQP
ncbi:prepilin-type N-terminal cleavage/methylation domain-containing protein [Vibrio intestinalis]|uniref:prepilin-type N-terminal cleavage/methylation domain-containing protein n=1 Tax=Vibrio intestinalis TaxID=2933291 RepID=UPI00242DBE65|nr:prepilin-type N-terminal cleavage/methylation domain-containing protein [Vibrio intestinalis]